MGSYAWLMAPHACEPDYGAYMLELDLLEASRANVATYNDWFPDERPIAATQQCGGPTRCSLCGELQFDTPSGLTCSNGHGGAPSSL